jgi:hypothetical protein
MARTAGMSPAPPPDADLAALRAEATHLWRVNRELLATVAELRAAVEKQEAHIDRLVRRKFGRRSEELTGPALFDNLPDPDPPLTGANTPGEGAEDIPRFHGAGFASLLIVSPRRVSHGRASSHPPNCR